MSNRKKWRWIFTGFAIAIFILIAVCLVLFEKYKKDDDNKDNEDNISTPPQTTEYATSLSLNVPETIQILINTKVKLSSGYINVTPIAALNKLTYEVTKKSGDDINGITFIDNIINANSVGTYSIKFKVPKSATTNFSKIINIIVYEDENSSHIYQTSNSLVVGESKNINELFSIKEGIDYQTESDSKITVSNGKFNAMITGDSEIKFIFTENYLQYIYNFNITIKEQPMYEIILLNAPNNTIEINFDDNPYAKIWYEIRNRNQEHVDQDVFAVSSDENIAKITNYTEPYINIEALKVGEVTITITYSHDTSIKLDVKIIVN